MVFRIDQIQMALQRYNELMESEEEKKERSTSLNTFVIPDTTDVTPETSPRAGDKKDKKKKKDKENKKTKEKLKSNIVEESKPPDFIANGFE